MGPMLSYHPALTQQALADRTAALRDSADRARLARAARPVLRLRPARPLRRARSTPVVDISAAPQPATS